MKETIGKCESVTVKSKKTEVTKHVNEGHYVYLNL